MKAKLLSAWGYQGDAMNLPVADADTAASYYVRHMGFAVAEHDSSELPHEDAIRRVILERDGVRFALAENGGDPEQDGCAFHTDNVEALRNEFIATSLDKIGKIGEETRDGGHRFKVFFVIAPDGLCYWFGQRQ